MKKLFFIISSLLFFVPASFALNFSNHTDLVNLTVIPEYKNITQNTSELTFISKIDIKQNWHLYWDNPGDTGDPTELIFFESPHYKEISSIHSAPQKSTFDDIITAYIHKQTLYYKTTFRLKNISSVKRLPFKLVLSYTVCKKECLPQTINLNLALPIKETADKNPTFFKNMIEAENTFPMPLKFSAETIDKNIKLEIAQNILKDCNEPEFISTHKKKSIIANLPKTSVSDDHHLNISFDEGELPPDMKGILLCPGYAYYLDSPQQQPLSQTAPEAPNTSIQSLLYYILIAFIAGLILNLMPCVLPILSLKALYLAQHKEKASPLSALVYLSGVLSSFLILSAILYYLRSLGTDLGWGFQLQSPLFNIFLIFLFFIIFLNLTDKLIISDRFADKLNKIAGSSGFLTGFFAVIIACPCTGPFMGSALGYALFQPTLIYFTIFLSLGLGYALPYVLIESFPAFFLKFVPKPGAWMITLKRILALPIALTCLWLIWITFNQLRPTSLKTDIFWEPYQKQAVAQSVSDNKPVLIDFTAKWCLVCLLNDKAVLDTAEFKTFAKQKGLKLYKADWTNHNDEIAASLKSYQRNSIPLYVYYPSGSNTPQYLPQILTMDIIKQYIR